MINTLPKSSTVLETEDEYYDRQFARINDLKDLTADALENYSYTELQHYV